eukprot:GEZU01002446.1.p1 GENE.GEZU01002446.1~~GEZU01002446.1.p1  ORF type:complete len:116 (-),score=10.52 GEZU01002446.1:212-559(-)
MMSAGLSSSAASAAGKKRAKSQQQQDVSAYVHVLDSEVDNLVERMRSILRASKVNDKAQNAKEYFQLSVDSAQMVCCMPTSLATMSTILQHRSLSPSLSSCRSFPLRSCSNSSRN